MKSTKMKQPANYKIPGQYNQSVTENHPLKQLYPDCLQTINSIFVAPENHGDGVLFGDAVGWNGDKVELQRAQASKSSSDEQVERKKSVDMAIGILLEKGEVPEMLLVELRIGVTPSKEGKQKRGAFRRTVISEKYRNSSELFAAQIPIYNKLQLIVSEEFYEEAKNIVTDWNEQDEDFQAVIDTESGFYDNFGSSDKLVPSSQNEVTSLRTR